MRGARSRRRLRLVEFSRGPVITRQLHACKPLTASSEFALHSGQKTRRGTLRGGGRLVYDWCMARTNIDIDDDACERVMRRYGLRTKREAVNLALRSLDAEPMCLNEAHGAHGVGRSLDLDVECAAKLVRLQSTAEMSASEIIGWGIEMVDQWHAERCRERRDAVLDGGFVGCLSAAPSDLAQHHRRYLDEAFGASGDAG